MSKKGRFVCVVCECNYVRKCNLVAHRRAVHDAPPNQISSGENADDKVQDMSTSTTNAGWTDVAETGANYIEVSHSKSNMQFGCSHCGRYFKSELVLKFHLKRVQQSKPGVPPRGTARLRGTEHQCGQCAFACTKFRTMEQHRSSAHGTKHYACAHCGAAFVRRVNLTAHLDDKHGPVAVDRHKCDTCSATFATRRSMQNHVRRDTCSRDQREKTAAAKSASSPGTIVCTLCSRTFTAEKNMRRHVATMHQDDHRFKCIACAKTFARRYMLYNHSMSCTLASVRTESTVFKSELYVMVEDKQDIKAKPMISALCV